MTHLRETKAGGHPQEERALSPGRQQRVAQQQGRRDALQVRLRPHHPHHGPLSLLGGVPQVPPPRWRGRPPRPRLRPRAAAPCLPHARSPSGLPAPARPLSGPEWCLARCRHPTREVSGLVQCFLNQHMRCISQVCDPESAHSPSGRRGGLLWT